MGHYDNCRPGHCAVCGQTGNLCGHDRMNPKEEEDHSADPIFRGSEKIAISEYEERAGVIIGQKYVWPKK